MALVTGRLTCRELVEGYLDRIEAYDQQGPALTSIIEVNPDALAEADALDAQGQVSRGAATGALHCVPVLVKDNIDVEGLPAFWDIVGVAPDAYTSQLDADGLDGARIGVVRGLFGNDPDVQATVNAAVEQMEATGATFEDVTIPELSTVTGFTSMSGYEFYDHLTGYLSSWEGDHPQCFDEVRSLVNERGNVFASRANLGADRYDNGFPALTMPAGFTEASEDRPALPVGMELLGREFDEPTLLGIAYAYEQTVAGTPLARQAPTTTPELEGAAPSGAGRLGAAPGRSADAPGRSGAVAGRR